MKFHQPSAQARLFLILTISLFITGCSAPGLDLSLKDASLTGEKASVQETMAVSVGVETFIDLRPQIRGSDNQKWLGYIPGVLWVDIASEIPEIYTAYSPYNSRPMKDTITEAVTAGLREAGTFAQVSYLPRNPYTNPDYHLEGILHKSYVKERGYYYGSSIYAWLLRILGLPYVSYEVALEVDLRLRDMTNHDIVWQGKIKGQRTDKYNNVYQLAQGKGGKHIIAYNFTLILQEQLPGLIKDMTKSLEKTENQR